MKLTVDTSPGSNSVACGLFIPSGAVTETRDQFGLSHFLEHLVFKGTPKRTAHDIAIEIDVTGGDLNAYTSVEYTSIFAKVLADDARTALDLILDIAYNPSLESDAIELERGVILSEIAEYLDSPDEIAGVRSFQAAWGENPLARPVLGEQEVIKSITETRIREYHTTHYQPKESVLSVAGKATAEQITEILTGMGVEIEPLSGKSRISLPKPEFSPKKIYMDRDSEQVYFTYLWPGPSLLDDTIAESLVLNVILAGSVSSRLFQRLREDEGLVYNISTMSSVNSSGGLIGVYGATQAQNFSKSHDIVLKEIEDLGTNGATAQELDRAKRMIKGSTLLSLDSTTARMDRGGRLGLLLGYIPDMWETLKRVEKLDLEAFNRYLGSEIPQDLAISLVGKNIKGLEGYVCE
ncbi:MAG: insulinase family protein [Caldiserica bacterium]|nr:insulinase family protein [Caldisericota bacterium]